MSGKQVHENGLPKTNRNNQHGIVQEILRETSCNIDSLQAFIDENEPKLLDEREKRTGKF